MPTSGQNFGAAQLPLGLSSQGLSRKSGVQVPAHIYQAVADASARSGVSFAYLMDKAATESSFNPTAKAGTSSASGLYQFIERTWLDMINKHGADYGLEKYADAITQRRDGSFSVSSRSMRQEILALRKDPKIASYMAAEYAKENKQVLEKALGREVNDTELYMAHFLGAGGATRFLKAMDRNPSATAASLLPDAAQANQSVFYNGRTGRALTLAQVFERFDDKFGSDVTYVAEGQSPDDGGFDVASLEPLKNQISDLISDYVPQAGAVPGADRPFFTTYLFSALETLNKGDSSETDINNKGAIPAYAGSLYQAASTPETTPAFVGFV